MKLTASKFSEHPGIDFEPDPKLNFLVGENGQGKTSFLEALGLSRDASFLPRIQVGRSDEMGRARSRDQRASWRRENDAGWKTDLKVVFQRRSIRSRESRAKSLSSTASPTKAPRSYLSQRFGSFELGFHAVVFNPSDHDLVRGEPAHPAGYLDRVIAAERCRLSQDLAKYQRVVSTSETRS